MYHQRVIEREQEGLERRLKTKLVRYDRDYCEAVEGLLTRKLMAFQASNPDLTSGQAYALLSDEEKVFVTNERLLCSVDFTYWAERYGWLLPDASVSDGNLTKFTPWESQKIVLDEMAKMELINYEAAKAGDPQDGVLLVVPKARQEGISLLAAMVKMHRITTAPYTLAVTASENEAKRLSLYVRDERVHSKLPWYMKPERTAPDIQGERLTFGRLESSILYQDYAQKGSLAAGEQYLLGHMSEVAQGNQSYIEALFTLDYFPAIPQSWRACHLLESTPAGMGSYWHSFVLESSAGKGRWRCKFIPWYVLTFKYTRKAPEDWVPSLVAEAHAEKVRLTSPQYCGREITLTRNQLYWWETSREEHRKDQKLAMFLTNYPATLEESFQSHAISIFDVETIEYYRTLTRDAGGTYEIITR